MENERRESRFETVETKMFQKATAGKRPITVAIRLTLYGQKDHPLSIPSLSDGIYLRSKLSVGEMGRDGRFHDGLPFAEGVLLMAHTLMCDALPDFERMHNIVEDRFHRLTDLKRAADAESKGDPQNPGTRHTGKTARDRQKQRAKHQPS